MHKKHELRKKGFNKKSQELSLWTIIEIVVVVLVAYAMFNFVADVKENRFFERSILSKDVALLENTIQSVPGDLFYSYVHNGIEINKYMFEFKNNRVVVRDLVKKENSEILSAGVLKNTYPVYDESELENKYNNFSQVEKIEFMKTNDEFKISENVEKTFGTKACEGQLSKNSKEEIKSISIVYINEPVSSKQFAQSLDESFKRKSIISNILSEEEMKKLIVNGEYVSYTDSTIKIFKSSKNLVKYKNQETQALSCIISKDLVFTTQKDEKQIEDIIIYINDPYYMGVISNSFKDYNELRVQINNNGDLEKSEDSNQP